MRNCAPTPRSPERGGSGNPPLKVRAPWLYPDGSGRQGHNPAGASPVMSIARCRHVAMPQGEQATGRPLRGVNGPAARWDSVPPAVGAVRGPSKCGSRNIREWLQPRNGNLTSKPRRGEFPRAEPFESEVRPMSAGKETGQSTGGARRGRGPSTRTRIGEITSGRAVIQQGLTATCKDPPHEGQPKEVGG